MNLVEQFELFVREAKARDLLQTDVFYRRTDGKPSKKIRVQYQNGERIEKEEDKPMKSVHTIDLGDGMQLRVKKSNFERKQHLEFLLTLAKETGFEAINERLLQVSGVANGKNVHWSMSGEKKDFVSIAHYFQKLAEDAEKEKVGKENRDLLDFNRAVLGDDLVLVEGW